MRNSRAECLDLTEGFDYDALFNFTVSISATVVYESTLFPTGTLSGSGG